MPTPEKTNYKAQYAKEAGTYYCRICGKTVELKSGDEIPLCCGQVMCFID